MKIYDDADDMAYRIFEIVMDVMHADDDTLKSNARYNIAEQLREIARGNIDTKNWNL